MFDKFQRPANSAVNIKDFFFPTSDKNVFSQNKSYSDTSGISSNIKEEDIDLMADETKALCPPNRGRLGSPKIYKLQSRQILEKSPQRPQLLNKPYNTYRVSNAMKQMDL